MIPFAWQTARNILMIYQILTPAHEWEFFAIDTFPDNGYCEEFSAKQAVIHIPLKIGDVRILCTEDRRVEI